MTLPVLRLLAALLLSAPIVRAAPPTVPADARPPMSDERVVAELRQHLAAEAATGAFSGAVLLAKGDRILFREAYGLAARETNVPNRADTRFNLGSINKAFTRLAVEQLAAAGKVRLSDTLDRWVPEYPAEKARKITLQHLIEHRAGTGDFFGPRYEAADRARLLTLRDWLPLIADIPLGFEPGARQEYSNAGYLLLGLVIEKASGQSYYDYVRDHIFTPAGMTSTESYATAARVPNLASGYTEKLGSASRDNGPSLPARGSSAGGGYSTVDDLFRFAKALRAGTLGGGKGGGLGIAGGAPGINAVLEMEGEYTTVVMANLDPPAASRVAEKIGGWMGRSSEGAPGGRRVRKGPLPEGPVRSPRSTTLPAGDVEVPLLRSGHLPAVNVMVNGQGPFLFAIDTGGQGAARVSAALAARLGLSKVGEILSGDPSGRDPQTRALMAVDTIEIGGARFSVLHASVRGEGEPSRPETVDGILGFGFFAECLLTLDYPANRLRLSRGSLPPADGKQVLDYRDTRGIPAFTITVAGRELLADLDTGSMGGIVLPESEAATLPLDGPLAVVGRARTLSNAFEIKAAPLNGDVTLGGLTFSRPRLEFQPVFPMANIGARVLRDLVLTFDPRNRRLRLVRPTAVSG
jgi:CubicO group peptidase (beta-lactamase class C family)